MLLGPISPVFAVLYIMARYYLWHLKKTGRYIVLAPSGNRNGNVVGYAVAHASAPSNLDNPRTTRNNTLSRTK
jgi:hypothetical protein